MPVNYFSQFREPNGAGFIVCPLSTLEDAFVKCPAGLGFNIEVKYPDPEEAALENIKSHDLNVFVSRILDIVFKHASGRPLIFSSFHPEACHLLLQKQNVYPVFYLTDGLVSHKKFDKRLASVYDSMTFVKEIGCAGVVINSLAIEQAPGIVSFIRDQGILVGTYGTANDFDVNAREQLNQGANAVITDKIREIRHVFSSRANETIP